MADPDIEFVRAGENLRGLWELSVVLEEENSHQATSLNAWLLVLLYPTDPDDSNAGMRESKFTLSKLTGEDARWRYCLDIEFDGDETITIKSARGQ